MPLRHGLVLCRDVRLRGVWMRTKVVPDQPVVFEECVPSRENVDVDRWTASASTGHVLAPWHTSIAMMLITEALDSRNGLGDIRGLYGDLKIDDRLAAYGYRGAADVLNPRNEPLQDAG
jgi:hypothetical protein